MAARRSEDASFPHAGRTRAPQRPIPFLKTGVPHGRPFHRLCQPVRRARSRARRGGARRLRGESRRAGGVRGAHAVAARSGRARRALAVAQRGCPRPARRRPVEPRRPTGARTRCAPARGGAGRALHRIPHPAGDAGARWPAPAPQPRPVGDLAGHLPAPARCPHRPEGRTPGGSFCGSRPRPLADAIHAFARRVAPPRARPFTRPVAAPLPRAQRFA